MRATRRHLLAALGGVVLGVGRPALAGSYEDFFAALRGNDARTVRTLLQRGFDPNAPDDKGQLALYLSLRDEAFAVAAVLIESPALDVDAANPAGETPLMMAALRGLQEWVEKLIARGAHVRREGWSPLHYAASGPSPAVVTLLLAQGADIEALSPNRTTPLMMAAGYGAIDSADMLLQRGADPHARNDAGMTAIDFARRAGRDALAARLDASTR